MPQVEIWVPILGNGRDDAGPPHTDPSKGPYRPDIPDGVDWMSDEGAPTKFGDPNHPPATTYFNILVDEADVEKCAKRVAEKDLIEKDLLLVNMLRACQGDWDQKADLYFDTIENIATADAERKQVIKDVLVQGVHRGISAKKAEEIQQEYGLP